MALADDWLLRYHNGKIKLDDPMVLWSYASLFAVASAQGLPIDASNDQRADVGGLVWQYVGRAPVATEEQPVTRDGARSFTFTYDRQADLAEAALPLRDRLVGTHVYTEAGMWELVDAPSALAVPPAVDALILPPADHRSSSTEEEESWPADGEVITWEPMSWFHQSCEPGGGNELHVWDLETRLEANMAFERPRASAKIVWDPPGPNNASECSGVFLRDHWVLTAAHCLVENNTVPAVSELTVSKPWAGKETEVVLFSINPDWDESVLRDFDDDWALIKTVDSLGPEDMDLSSANDTLLQSVGANFHNLGFPLFAPLCTETDRLTLFHSDDNDITAFQNVRLRWRGDGSPGHSGGPVYYCPDGDVTQCGSGEKGFVVSVFAGWNPTYDRFVGPRVSEWRDEAIVLMDTL